MTILKQPAPPVLSKLPRELPTLVLILLLGVWMLFAVPASRDWGNVMAVGQSAAFIGLLACGEGLVIMAGGLDLSVGATLALSGCVAAMLLVNGVPTPIGILAGLGAGGIAGLLNGGLITDRLPIPLPEKLRDFLKLKRQNSPRPPILTTLATLLLFRYGVSILTQSKSYNALPTSFYDLGQGIIPIALFVAVVGGLVFVTLKMQFGRWLFAVGGGEQASNLSGVPTDRVKQICYLLAGLSAGLMGVVSTAFNNHAQWDIGKGAELDAIAACVVGGVRITGGEGSILGIAYGAVLIALLQNALVLAGRPKEQYGLFTGGVILAAAIFEQWRSRRK